MKKGYGYKFPSVAAALLTVLCASIQIWSMILFGEHLLTERLLPTEKERHHCGCDYKHLRS